MQRNYTFTKKRIQYISTKKRKISISYKYPSFNLLLQIFNLPYRSQFILTTLLSLHTTLVNPYWTSDRPTTTTRSQLTKQYSLPKAPFVNQADTVESPSLPFALRTPRAACTHRSFSRN